MATYTVKSGDTKSKLRQQYGITLDDTQYRSTDPNKLFAGEILNIPDMQGPVDLSKVREGVQPYPEPKPEQTPVPETGTYQKKPDGSLVYEQTPQEFADVTFESLDPAEQVRRTADTVAAEIKAIEDRMSLRETDRNNAYDDAGVFDDMQVLNRLKDEMRTIEDREIEIPVEARQDLRGRQATKTEFNNATRPELEKNLLSSLAKSREVSRLTDTINTNIAVIDSRIKADTDRDEFLYTQKKDRLTKLESVYGNIITEEQKAKLEERKFQYDLALEAVKSDNSLRADLIKEIAKKGVGGVQLQGLMDASIDELVSFQGELVSPKNWSTMTVEEAGMRMDKDTFERFMDYKNWEKTATEEEKAAVNQGLAIEQSAKSTISLLEGLLNDEQGLKNSVGTGGIGNMDFSFFGAGVETTKFRAGAKQLLSQATLDKLLELKAAGGTLGAISEKELDILANAATALGAIYDDKDKATGRFKFKEEDFKEALETMRIASMKTYIASRIGKEAYARADYINADFDTIQKRYTDLVESGPSQNYADNELQNPGYKSQIGEGDYITPTLNLLRNEEGLRTEAYQDSTGTWTIGYGTTTINGRPVKQGDKLTKEQAEIVMQNQVINNYTTFADTVQSNITPNQFAALTSFEYNLGPGVWKTPTGSQILSLVNSGRYAEAGRLMLQYHKSRDPKTGELVPNRVLAQRRAREADLLLA